VRLASVDGQSTVEYAGLVLITAAVLATGAAGLHATGIAEALIGQIQRSICRASGGECRAVPEPCVVTSTATQDDTSLRIAILRLRSGTTLLRERRSDGSERVTLVRLVGGGAGLGLGAEIGAGTWVLGGRVDGSVEARGASGRVWTLHSARAADALVRSIGARQVVRGRTPRGPRARPAPLPPADAVFGGRGLGATIAGNLERVGLSLDTEDLFSTTTDRRTGERTLVIRRHSDLLGTLGVAGPLGAEAGLGRDDRAALVVDSRGRPLRLTVTGVRRVQAGVRLPGPLRLLVGGRLPLREGRIVQTERRLDLSDPANLAAAGAYVRALRDPAIRLASAFAVSAALRRRLDAAGETRLRVYALSVRHSGAQGGIDVGVGLGGGFEHAVESARLIAAGEREAGGVWRTRDDCLVGA
jgi:hypothetical protein